MNKLVQMFRKRSGLLIIIFAALIVELLSAAQYYYTHRLMEEELEKRAEAELTMKAILIKSTLNQTEDVLKYHLWDLRENLYHPDSVAKAIGRMIMLSRYLQGGAMGFVPNYYPSKGRLYEPYALKRDGKVETFQAGGPENDYTKGHTYGKGIATDGAVWIEPYEDKVGAQTKVITYAMPVYDKVNKLAGIAGIDISLEWLRDTIDRRHIYPSSFILLLTEGGKPIIQPNEERISRETTEYIISLINDSTVAREKSSSGRSTAIYFDTDDREGTIFYANMKGQPHWVIAVVCYDDEVYASLLYLRYRLLFLMLLAFGILLYLITSFMRKEEKLRKQTQEQEYINKELQIACDIQQALLPKDKEELNIDDVAVEGRLIPAKAVGGDLYNAFTRDGKLFFCIGDVTGKGIPAAIIMAITQTLFRNIASRESNPAHIMEQLNQAACRNNKANIFVTLFIGVLDLPTGHLRYCNAGHEIPLINKEILDAKPNLPIGIFDDFKYQKQEMKMVKGDMLFLYTDGLTEAKNEKKELLGRNHVIELISSIGTANPKAMIEGVIAKWKQFIGDTEQSDDLTMLAICYTPKEEQNILDEELNLTNNVKEVATLSAFVKDVLTRLNIGKPLASKLRLALEEAVVNAMEYAYPKGSTGKINIRVTCSVPNTQQPTPSIQHLKFIISDSGVSFNPTEATKADTTLTAEERPVGGLGILLVRELMDSINYERINGKNILTLTKIINN